MANRTATSAADILGTYWRTPVAPVEEFARQSLKERAPRSQGLSGLNVDPFDVLKASVAPQAYQKSVAGWLAVPGREDIRVRFERLVQEGRAALVEISAESLQRLAEDGRILFREKVIDIAGLRKISLPLEPDYLNKRGGQCDGPVLFVRVGPDYTIPNGNHRVYKVAHQQGTNHPLLAVFFDSIDSYAECIGDRSIDLAGNSCRFPAVRFGSREHKD